MQRRDDDATDSPPSLSVRPVERWLAPVTRFLHVEAASGTVLLACTAIALGLANSPLADWFAALWTTRVSLTLGGFTLAGGACLAGIGFTMALFINALTFPVADFPAKEVAGKVGTLAGSFFSAVLGAVVLSTALMRGVASRRVEAQPSS